MLVSSVLCLVGIIMLLALSANADAKECSRIVTAEMRENAVRNAERYSWAKDVKASAIAGAKQWAEASDEWLWHLVPSQELPRDIYSNNFDASKSIGCANCGDGYREYGRWGFKTDIFNKPWKMICPNCGAEFPKNDFGKFYESALDENGFFRRELGDRSLLFNAEHPDPSDPLHNVYVDDGYGMIDAEGNKRLPIAYYCQWGIWRGMVSGLDRLSWAYSVTGDPLYAHKAAVLLDRIADVYPDMAWKPLAEQGFKHSDGNSKRGRVEGCIWECGQTETMARAYDRIYDGIQNDEELVRFCNSKAAEHKLSSRSTVADICRHIEDGLLLEILKGTKDGDIHGNTGMQQGTVVATAIALDRPGVSDQWLDWAFDPAYPGDFTRKHDSIPWVLTDGLDRDGMGGEVGGYGLIWANGFIRVAEMLARYPRYTNHDILREFPKLKQCFFVQARLNCLDAAMPMTGDNGSTGTWSRTGSADLFMRGYQLYHDERLASLACHYAEGDSRRLRTSESIFTAEPEAVAAEVFEIGAKLPFKLQSDHMGRYGQAVLQTDTTDPARGRAAWMHYGQGLGHSHRDNLNLGLYAKNISMLPDFGYPEYCEGRPKQYAWTANTISHNTLLVDDTMQQYSPGGKVKLFADQPPLRVVDVDSSGAYPQCETYRRTVAMVDISAEDSYVLDVFRARGGSNHRLLYQGPSQTAEVSGIIMKAQDKGTFAGPEIMLDQLEINGQRDTSLYNSGFSYLWNVERSDGAVEAPYTVDWKGEDRRGRIKAGAEPHLRLHALTQCGEVALASAQPPPNKPGNPKSLRKVIQSRMGNDVTSQFVNVLEPYDTAPFIASVRTLDVERMRDVEHSANESSVVAVEVRLLDGTTDILINCEEPTAVKVAGGIEFDGVFGMVRFVDGQVALMRMCNSTRLSCAGIELVADRPAYRGVVTAVNVEDASDNRVQLDPPLPAEFALAGQTIMFENDLPMDTSYEIKRVIDDGISTGDITLIRRFKDSSDYAAGYEYLVNAGDKYTVPVCAGVDVKTVGSVLRCRATGTCRLGLDR